MLTKPIHASDSEIRVYQSTHLQLTGHEPLQSLLISPEERSDPEPNDLDAAMIGRGLQASLSGLWIAEVIVRGGGH